MATVDAVKMRQNLILSTQGGFKVIHLLDGHPCILKREQVPEPPLTGKDVKAFRSSMSVVTDRHVKKAHSRLIEQGHDLDLVEKVFKGEACIYPQPTLTPPFF